MAAGISLPPNFPATVTRYSESSIHRMGERATAPVSENSVYRAGERASAPNAQHSAPKVHGATHSVNSQLNHPNPPHVN